MRRQFTLFLASARALNLVHAATTLAYGPSGSCPAPATTEVVSVIPIYYSTVISEGISTQINVFGNEDTVNIYAGPTTVVSTSTTTVTSTFTAIPTNGLGNTTPQFYISAQDTSSKGKRAVSYIGFAGNDGILVNSLSDAGLFQLVNGFLMFGTEFVTAGTGAGAGNFMKNMTTPTLPGTWSTNNGVVEFNSAAFTIGGGEALFCVASDEDVFIELTSAPSFTCAELILETQAGKL